MKTDVLGKAAKVENAVLGTDGRICEWRFLAPVVKTRPEEKPAQVGPVRIVFPNFLDAGALGGQIGWPHVAGRLVRFVNTPGLVGRAFFRRETWLIGKLFMLFIC